MPPKEFSDVSADRVLNSNCELSSPAIADSPSPAALARQWVEEAIEAGFDPLMIQRPLSSISDPGEWKLITFNLQVEGSPELRRFPQHLWDETFRALYQLGRVWRSCDAKLWDAQLFPEDCSTEAVSFRLKFAREALNLDHSNFYKPCDIRTRTAKAWENGKRRFENWPSRRFEALCEVHDIPLEWLLFGEVPESLSGAEFWGMPAD